MLALQVVKTGMHFLILLVLSITTVLLPYSIALAHNKVVVVPLGSDAQNLANVITVAKQGGDFASPIAALNSIPNTGPNAPSEDKPYGIFIAPGVYTIAGQLTMRPFVSIIGSGKQSTIIRGSASAGSASANAAVLVAASDASLSNLTIENVPTDGGIAIGSYAANANLHFQNLAIRVFTFNGISQAYGLFNQFSGGHINNLEVFVGAGDRSDPATSATGIENRSSPLFIDGVKLKAFGNNLAVGINNRFSATRMSSMRIESSATLAAVGLQYFDDGSDFINEVRDSKIIANADEGNVFVLRVEDSSPQFQNLDLEVLGAESAIALQHLGSAHSELSHSRARISASSDATGISVSSSVASRVSHTTIETNAPSAAAFGGLGAARLHVANSLFINGVVAGTGTYRCSHSSLESGGNFSDLSGSCGALLE